MTTGLPGPSSLIAIHFKALCKSTRCDNHVGTPPMAVSDFSSDNCRTVCSVAGSRRSLLRASTQRQRTGSRPQAIRNLTELGAMIIAAPVSLFREDFS